MPLSYNKLFDDLYDNIMDLRSITKVKDVLWKSVQQQKPSCKRKCAKNIKILILNTPCNGFGDLIFALKLSKYLRDWYGGTIKIASTISKGLLQLGEKQSNVIHLDTKTGKRTQCRRFARLRTKVDLSGYDLYLVAPITADFDADMDDVRRLVPSANRMNTFFFSEYNDILKGKKFDFNTGIGKNRDGLLLTKTPDYKRRPIKLRNPYSLVYVAGSIDRVEKCILSFLEMICDKYEDKYPQFDVVVPSWIVKEKEVLSIVARDLNDYYPNISLKVKGKRKEIPLSVDKTSKKKLTLRADILPVPNKDMLRIMEHTVDDVLLTGDQSITDMLSCCSEKNIFYQIAPWKISFGKDLAKLLPNSYLKSVKTSCGTMKAIKYKSNYKKFVQKWDFRKRGKSKLDSIVLGIKAAKKDEEIGEVYDMLKTSRNLRSLKKQVREYAEV